MPANFLLLPDARGLLGLSWLLYALFASNVVAVSARSYAFFFPTSFSSLLVMFAIHSNCRDSFMCCSRTGYTAASYRCCRLWRAAGVWRTSGPCCWWGMFRVVSPIQSRKWLCGCRLRARHAHPPVTEPRRRRANRVTNRPACPPNCETSQNLPSTSMNLTRSSAPLAQQLACDSSAPILRSLFTSADHSGLPADGREHPVGSPSA